MDTLLDALQEGRLIELPDNNKDDALQFLAHIIEAIPSLPTGIDVVGLVMAKERSTTSALGNGWASPHVRVPFEEDLICVVGWSPTGIEYGASDGNPVSIIALYLVPENQRNHYLREVSM
ncbi:MAG: PTS sugar transporter subunit IIA, partial [Syntrophobacteraceae bacterium]